MPTISDTVTDSITESQTDVQKQMATLIHPDTGARQAVEVGSQEAQGLFGEGYVLEESPDTPVAGAVQATTGKVTSGEPITAAGKFVSVVQEMSQEKISSSRSSLLDADESFDTQVQLQRGALYTALIDQASALTDENLRWLTPSQQSAIRNGDTDLIKSAIIGLNSILQTREDKRKEDEAKAEAEEAQARADAENTFNLIAQYGLWDRVDSETLSSLETTLGFAEGTMDMIQEKASESSSSFELRSGPRSSIIEVEMDENGRVIGTRTIVAGTGGSSSSSSSSSSTTTEDDVLTYQQFLSALGEELSFSFDPSNAENEALYQEYLTENGLVEPSTDTTSSISDDDYFDNLTTTDKKKMIAQGLNPNSISDVKTYYNSLTGSSDEEEKSAFEQALGL